jgi:murein DD-endopeptidase MepM/ murein hydrolase activator NlpD
MTEGVASIVKRNAFRFAMTGLVGIWLSGCADATRFADSGSPFSNPFAGDSAAPTPRVASTPLVSERPLNRNYAAAARPSPSVASAAPMPAPEATGSIRPSRPEPVGGSSTGWTAVGGSPVIVGESDDAATLSRRYGVPESALLSANGLRSRSDVHANMRIVIPVYNAHGETRVAKADEEDRDAARARRAAKAEEEDRDAAKARRLAKADEEDRDAAKARRAKRAEADDDSRDDDKKADRGESSHKKHKAEAKADRDDDADSEDGKSDKKLAKAEKLKKEKAEKLAKADAEEKPAKPLRAEKAPEVAKADPPKAKRPDTDRTPTASVAPAAEATTAQASENGQFRWPARGRIIQGFKSGGNDGINIALPEGTSVRAAEDGKVAYAGNALKGYGNLVLIRHSNGFVSAYANNGELDVKQGESVKRGQVIAKSGATGDVSTPQLHFELRRGQTPVDPTSYLAGL